MYCGTIALRQALSQIPQAQKNLQPKHRQDQLQLHEQHETNNRQP